MPASGQDGRQAPRFEPGASATPGRSRRREDHMARPTVPAAANLFGSTERAAEPRTSAPHRKVTIYAPIDLLADVDELATFLSRQGVTVDRSRMIREALRICLLDDQQEWIDALKRDEE